MTRDPNDLISGYFDESLSADEHAAMTEWIRSDPEHARQFADAALLHDRLRDELVADATLQAAQRSLQATPVGDRWRITRVAAAFMGIAAAGVIIAFILNSVAESPASAAEVELGRVIAASSQGADRTYSLTVEEVASPEPGRPQPAERNRPPKAPMEGAVLHVRPGHQFVLQRELSDGMLFVTGSNATTSWAVRPTGPVKVSADRTTFSRDVPGHEHAMALTDTEQALQTLRSAYDVSVLPMEAPTEGGPGEEGTRLLVAVKRPGNRGPKRVEITYGVASGRIVQIRFVEMPYGPERLTLRLTLVGEADLGPSFFDHTAHHAPDRRVEQEQSP
jgi:hypothetical protein